jgi:hypothetical protein
MGYVMSLGPRSVKHLTYEMGLRWLPFPRFTTSRSYPAAIFCFVSFIRRRVPVRVEYTCP